MICIMQNADKLTVSMQIQAWFIRVRRRSICFSLSVYQFTRYPFFAILFAVSNPSPEFAPVIMYVFILTSCLQNEILIYRDLYKLELFNLLLIRALLHICSWTYHRRSSSMRHTIHVRHQKNPTSLLSIHIYQVYLYRSETGLCSLL